MSRLAFLLALILTATACSSAYLEHDPKNVFNNPTAYSALEEMTKGLQLRDPSAVARLLHSEYQTDESAAAELATVIASLPPGDLRFDLFYAENRVGLDEHAGVPIYFAVYETETTSGFLQLSLAVSLEKDVCCVGTYIKILPTAERPSTFNDLTLVGKGWLHFLIAITSVGVFCLIIYTAIKCAFASNTTRKWLWVPFILVGLWGVTFNWSTGQLSPSFLTLTDAGVQLKVFEFHLLGVGVTTPGPFRPWVVEIGTPVGAIFFWLFPKLRKRRESSPEIESL